MQSNQHCFPQYSILPPADQGGADYFSDTPGSIFGGMVLPPGLKPLRSFHGVEVQPSEACPKNFIIFDQTDNRSQILFHPANSSHLCYNGLTFGAPLFQDNIERYHANNDEREISSYQKEDSADIDALLSLEADESQESDEEEVSTARTDANYGSNSPDSYSNYGSHPKKCRLSSVTNSAASGRGCSGRKRQKMRKMVKALRGIIPRTGQMNTVAVLDEAVKYLKSLKVEVQKLGVGNSNSYI